MPRRNRASFLYIKFISFFTIAVKCMISFHHDEVTYMGQPLHPASRIFHIRLPGPVIELKRFLAGAMGLILSPAAPATAILP
jgi:hypothetical protein